MKKNLLLFSTLSGAFAVALGAMGAHYLKSKIETGQMTPESIQTFETAVKYQFYHTLVLIFIVLLSDRFKTALLNYSAYCFIAGIVFFSGSLYLLSTKLLLGIENWRWLGPITPLGGICFISGWLFLFFSFLKKEKT